MMFRQITSAVQFVLCITHRLYYCRHTFTLSFWLHLSLLQTHYILPLPLALPFLSHRLPSLHLLSSLASSVSLCLTLSLFVCVSLSLPLLHSLSACSTFALLFAVSLSSPLKSTIDTPCRQLIPSLILIFCLVHPPSPPPPPRPLLVSVQTNLK